MKKINLLLTILCLMLIPGILKSQTYDLQFIEELNNGTNFNVRVQIKASSNFQLAASNITFNFNSTGLSNPTLLTAYNFNGINFTTPPFYIYGDMTVSNPNTGVASINIVFTQTNSSLASTVGTNWIDVASIGFNTTNSSLFSNFVFRSANPTSTVVYSCSGSGGSYTTTLLVPGTWSTLDNPLPVELSSFAAKMYDQDKVKLNWSTQTEVNNYGFNVERQTQCGQWEKVGFVNGNGNSNSPKEYSFIDKSLIGGSKFLYRLKQVDNDGQFEYSEAVEVEVVPTQFELSQNYPNPFNPSTKIRYQLPQESKVVIKIYNILGSEVMELVNDKREAGVYEVEFNASNLSSGTYIYKIAADNFVQTKKMILLK
jgi:hypothetical protein